MPDGQIYYEVPGNPGYVFDPVASRASGRQTFRKNPQLAITAQQEEQDRIKEAQEQEAFNRSPTGQLLPVVGSTAGLIAASQLMTPAADPVSAAIAAQIQQQTAAQAAAQGATQVATPNIIGASASPITTGAGGGSAVGGGFGGGAAGAETAAQTGGMTAAQYAGAAAALYGGYKSYEGMQNGGEGLRSGLTTTGAGIGTMILPGIGTAIGAAGGNLLGYGLQGDGFKNDLALAGVTGGLSLVPGVGDGIRGALIHKTTKQHQSEKWQEMANSDDPATAAYAQGYLDVIDKGDGSGPTFEDITAREGGGSGRDVWGASAFFDAFKDKGGWLNTTAEQREVIAKRALDEGLLTGSKGDIIAVDDKALSRIQQIGDEVLKTPAQAAAESAIQSTKLPTQGQMKNPSILGNGSQYKPYTPPNKDPNDPNTYGIDADGNVVGTLIGYKPQGSSKEINPGFKVGNQVMGSGFQDSFNSASNKQSPSGYVNSMQAPYVSLQDSTNALKSIGIPVNEPQINDKMFIVGRDGAAPPIVNTPAQAAALEAMRRTNTLSPGIGLDGKPIIYRR